MVCAVRCADLHSSGEVARALFSAMPPRAIGENADLEAVEGQPKAVAAPVNIEDEGDDDEADDEGDDEEVADGQPPDGGVAGGVDNGEVLFVWLVLECVCVCVCVNVCIIDFVWCVGLCVCMHHHTTQGGDGNAAPGTDPDREVPPQFVAINCDGSCADGQPLG